MSRIHVNNGDTVEEGALLIKLDNVSVLSEIEIVESELDVLLPRLARLEAETKGLNTVAVDEMLRARAKERPSAADGLADEIALFVTREEALRQEADWLNEKVGMLRTQLRGLEPQIVSLDKRLASLAGESSIQRKLLKKGLTTLNALTALSADTRKFWVIKAGSSPNGPVSAVKSIRLGSASCNPSPSFGAMRCRK